jgi:hypothetical protein
MEVEMVVHDFTSFLPVSNGDLVCFDTPGGHFLVPVSLALCKLIQ